jgi:hypothetical protein
MFRDPLTWLAVLVRLRWMKQDPMEVAEWKPAAGPAAERRPDRTAQQPS